MRDDEKINDFYNEYRRMPTYEEMKDLFSVASKNTVAYRVNKLLESGFLRKEDGHLILNEVGSVMKLGTVQAGFLTLAEEDVDKELISLDDFLIEKKGSTYMLEVVGESMKDAGILPKDLVLIERGKSPRRGDIVLALLENEYTLKYLDYENSKPVLVPANRSFKKIYPNPNKLRIEGVLRGVIRKYR